MTAFEDMQTTITTVVESEIKVSKKKYKINFEQIVEIEGTPTGYNA
jgi:hypothetical protein